VSSGRKKMAERLTAYLERLKNGGVLAIDAPAAPYGKLQISGLLLTSMSRTDGQSHRFA
jgi:hypothetical protein